MPNTKNLNSSNNKLNIAFLGNQIAWGGGAKSLLLLIKALSSHNLNLFLYVTNISSDSMKLEFEKYVKFVKKIDIPELVSAQNESILENTSSFSEEEFCVEKIKSFAFDLIDNNIDILHINNSVFSPIYKTIKDTSKIKIVTHVREWVDWNGIHDKQKYIIKNIINYSDSIICISNIEGRMFQNYSNLNIIPNPFDFDEIIGINNDQKFIRKKYGINQNAFIIGMMSSFMEEKGILDFLKVLNYLKRTDNQVFNITFIFIGQALPDFKRLLRILLKWLFGKPNLMLKVYKYLIINKLTQNILFFSKRKDILEIVNCFDIAIRPSYSGDPWGRDIIEYMALRKPIIATGDSEFYIKPNINGFLVPVHDVERIAKHILWLKSNDKERFEMGESAFHTIFEMCNINDFGTKILKIYHKLVSEENCVNN